MEFSQASHVESGINASKLMICLPPTGIAAGPILPWICWNLWLARNNKIFSARDFTAEETSHKATKDAREWLLAQSTEPKESLKQADGRIEPIETTLRCYTDATWLEESKIAGLGWIAKDTSDRVVFHGSATMNHVRSPLMAEALAIREALLYASNKSMNRFRMVSDSQVLINLINNKAKNIEIYGILQDIESLSLNLQVQSFGFVKRDLNAEADTLAKSALSYVTNISGLTGLL